MTFENGIEGLEALLEASNNTFESAESLLLKIKGFIGFSAEPDSLVEIKKLQRDFIIDSFKVNKFHKEYKNFINEQKFKVINSDVKDYNRKYGQTSRLNSEIEELDAEFESLRRSIKLLDFKFSIQTIKQYNSEELLNRIQRDENGEYPAEVDLSQLFSLETNSSLPSPDFKVFNKLLNIEYRLRVQKRIKYEILLLVKNQLTSNNRKWTTRDATLNNFMINKLPEVIQEVEKIKQNEHEDLKEFDYSEDEVEDEEIDIEQEIEGEETETKGSVKDDNDSDLEENAEGTNSMEFEDAEFKNEIIEEELDIESEPTVVEEKEQGEEQDSETAEEIENSLETKETTPFEEADDIDEHMMVDS